MSVYRLGRGSTLIKLMSCLERGCRAVFSCKERISSLIRPIT